MSNIAERLERLPFGRFHYRLLLMGGLGYMFEAVDAGIIAFLLPTLRPLWHLTSVETGLLASSTYFGFLIGALMAGWLGDRYGRRTVMSSALVFFCAASLASAFVSDWHSFFAFRAIGGIGMGAEAAIIAPFLSEFVPSARRGAFTASLATFFCFGFTSAALIGFFVVPAAPDGWRYALVVTALPVVLVLWWRRSLYESPRWLASQGRHQEADAVVGQIEQEFLTRGVVLPPPQPGRPVQVVVPASFARNFVSLWSPALRRVTTMTWVLWLSVTFCNYAYLAWLPTLFIDRGMTVTRSFSYVILIYLAQAPGYFLAAYLCERIGRPNTIVTYMLCAAVSAGLLAFADTDIQVLGLSMLLSAFSNGIAAGQYAYTPEVFPTQVRATGVGSASAFGRIGGISAPIIVGAIYPTFGFSGVFAMTTVVLLTGAAAVMLLGVPTKNRSLEDISAERVPEQLA